MEFPFDINHLFPERFSILDQTLVAGRKTAGMPHLQANIETVIDELGRASAKAQQLPASITSASKLQSQKHQLYLLKDGESNGGRGVVVGFLKVGYKKLFLLDRQGSHVEAEPLCILDFYIAENLQRYGYGRELFDFMLQHKKLEPVLMAYDRPSPKFLSFLAKHYCLTPSVPQANNFVVFEGFFVNIAGSPSSPLPDQGMFSFFRFSLPYSRHSYFSTLTVAQLRKVPLRKPDGEIKPYSLMEREVVHQEQRARPWPFAPPHSPQRSVSSQCSPSLSGGSSPSRPRPQAAPVPALGRSREQSPQSPLLERCRERHSSLPNFSLTCTAIPSCPPSSRRCAPYVWDVSCSEQGGGATCSPYRGPLNSRAAGLLHRPSPGPSLSHSHLCLHPRSPLPPPCTEGPSWVELKRSSGGWIVCSVHHEGCCSTRDACWRGRARGQGGVVVHCRRELPQRAVGEAGAPEHPALVNTGTHSHKRGYYI
ncbi:alpha-tubulin N-acetyltransferase 1 isoform X2 [Gymnodraco acuticeps]|uniref:Alpha-tubulin N-acetyltransferase 1 n=1 Tax=Gymnodraco acuticeps TaxID=8218 RepID=A0A6P8TFW4_GYMAC|nr:alpha-tubulin N-acetyltransferase 1 isoform X2 [Gymnodraco acuticeps]